VVYINVDVDSIPAVYCLVMCTWICSSVNFITAYPRHSVNVFKPMWRPLACLIIVP